MTAMGSIWLADGSPTVREASIPLHRGATWGTDVLVAGGGITGLLVALAMAEAGLKVTVIDARGFGESTSTFATVKLTAAHGTVLARIAAAGTPEAAVRYGQANLEGLARIRDVISCYGISCDHSLDTQYVYTTSDSGLASLRETARLSALAGIPTAEAGALPIPVEATGALEHRDQSLLQPAALLQGLIDACASLGVWFLPGLSAWSVAGDRVGLRVGVSDGSSVFAGHVVAATHMPFLDRGGDFASLSPSRAFAIAAVLPEGVPAGTTYASDLATRSTRTLRRDGKRWLVAVGEHDVVGRGGTRKPFVDRLTAWARDVFGVTEIGYQWSAQDLHSPDHLPVVGPLGEDPRVLMATGFGGWGFTNAAAAADVLQAMVLGTPASPWARDWDPQRTALPGSLPGLVSPGVEVAGRFVGDRMRTLAGADPASLAAGQASVALAGSRAVASYRDPAGCLHQLDARCTHLGALVRWNDAATSWDCPCHGSRFSINGEVLEGPARIPLERLSPGSANRVEPRRIPNMGSLVPGERQQAGGSRDLEPAVAQDRGLAAVPGATRKQGAGHRNGGWQGSSGPAQ